LLNHYGIRKLNTIPEANVHFSLDGLKPNLQFEKYTKAITVRDGDQLKYITTSPSGRVSKYETNHK